MRTQAVNQTEPAFAVSKSHEPLIQELGANRPLGTLGQVGGWAYWKPELPQEFAQL